MEAQPKGVKERVARHVRVKKVTPVESNPEPQQGKPDADNDPRNTTKGRQSLRGSRLRRKAAWMKRNPQKFTEAVEFINKHLRQPIDVVLQEAKTLKNPLEALELLEALQAKDDQKELQQWFASCAGAIRSVMEAVDYRHGPFLGKLGEDEAVLTEQANLAANKMAGFLPRVWVERVEDPKRQLVLYWAASGSSEQYSQAIDRGITRSFRHGQR
jgi:hypothetical protein